MGKTVGEQLALGLEDGQRLGRVERAVQSALTCAANDLSVDLRLDTGLMTLAREMAAGVDTAARKRDPYAIATASRELREVLARLKLDPTARTAGTVGELSELLTQIAKPTPPKA